MTVEKTLTLPNVCEVFHVSERTVRRWIADKKISVVRIEGTRRILFPEREVQRMLSGGLEKSGARKEKP